jgi:protease-4
MAMSKTAKTLLIIGGICLAVFLVAIIGIALIAESMSKPSVPNNSLLVLKVEGDLPDYSPENSFGKLFGQDKPSFTSLLTQLRKAKVDTRIGAVLLDVDSPSVGWGKADELREAIADFKKAGKPIYSYMETGANKDYYIATATDKIYLPPSGDLYVNGFAANVMFYRGSLDKIGVEPDFIQIGKYKNAPDQYMRKDMSEGHREVMNAILDDYYNRFTSTIAETRKKSPEDVKALIDSAPFNAVKAKEVGLIDDAIYRDQVFEQIKKQLGYREDDKISAVSGSEYREIPSDSLGLNKGEEVAVIYASGAIVSGRSSNGGFNGEMAGSDTLVRAINNAAEDKGIKAIVLRVDSPGGSALASDLMWHAIENAKAKKPIVVSMSDMAASGGYYNSCNANKIVAEPSTLTGSIGIFMGKMNVRGLYNWLGVSNEYVMRGKNSGIFREAEKWTPEERAKMEESTKGIYYDSFVPKVAKGRGKTNEEVDSMAQGRVWTGFQAKEKGLVDEFGGLEKAIDVAKELAQLPADKDVKRVIFPEARPFFEELLDTSGASAKEQKQEILLEAMPKDARKAFRFASILDEMNGKVTMMLPFELEIK